MYIYESYITGATFDEITPEIINKYYDEEFDVYLEEWVGTPTEISAMAEKNEVTVYDIIREAMCDFARIIEENPWDFYLNVREIVD